MPLDKMMTMEIDVPVYIPERGLRLHWDNGFEIRVMTSDGQVAISANRAGLRSLARHLLTLAQDNVPSGHHLHLDEGNALEDGSLELVLVRVDSDPLGNK